MNVNRKQKRTNKKQITDTKQKNKSIRRTKKQTKETRNIRMKKENKRNKSQKKKASKKVTFIYKAHKNNINCLPKCSTKIKVNIHKNH